MTARRYDVCIVGAGLVGLAVATALADEYPGISLLVLDKESAIAAHQSGHNSGVIHSGLYYRPGSLKARLCVEGRYAMYRLCSEAGIPVERFGKLVIAAEVAELEALTELERRGRANGLRGLERLGPEGIREVEPHAAGVAALLVPEAGVVDFPAVASHLADRLLARGADIGTGHPVTAIDHREGTVEVIAGGERFVASRLINCAGLHSDRVARLAGIDPPVTIVPFRGEYYRMAPDVASLVRGLVYPVPDPRFPFLGVHFTRRIDGTVEVGPNAVLALGREQYRGDRPSWGDLRQILSSRGFRRLARRHWKVGLGEMWVSRSTRRYARQARRLLPEVEPAHLLPGGSGVRAQAVAPDGTLVDDFVIEEAGPTLHVLNAPSPGATASLAIGRHLAGRIRPRFPR